MLLLFLGAAAVLAFSRNEAPSVLPPPGSDPGWLTGYAGLEEGLEADELLLIGSLRVRRPFGALDPRPRIKHSLFLEGPPTTEGPWLRVTSVTVREATLPPPWGDPEDLEVAVGSDGVFLAVVPRKLLNWRLRIFRTATGAGIIRDRVHPAKRGRILDMGAITFLPEVRRVPEGGCGNGAYYGAAFGSPSKELLGEEPEVPTPPPSLDPFHRHRRILSTAKTWPRSLDWVKILVAKDLDRLQRVRAALERERPSDWPRQERLERYMEEFPEDPQVAMEILAQAPWREGGRVLPEVLRPGRPASRLLSSHPRYQGRYIHALRHNGLLNPALEILDRERDADGSLPPHLWSVSLALHRDAGHLDVLEANLKRWIAAGSEPFLEDLLALHRQRQEPAKEKQVLLQWIDRRARHWRPPDGVWDALWEHRGDGEVRRALRERAREYPDGCWPRALLDPAVDCPAAAEAFGSFEFFDE